VKKKYDAAKERLENDVKEITELIQVHDTKILSIDQSTPVKLNKYDAAKDRSGSERDHGMSK
jgi:copper oxidase (laccase) domain-containing protein